MNHDIKNLNTYQNITFKNALAFCQPFSTLVRI